MGNYYLQTSQNWSNSVWYDAASLGNARAEKPGVADTLIVNTTKILTIDTNDNPINVAAIVGNGTGTIAINAYYRNEIVITAGNVTGGSGGVLFTITGVGTINLNIPQMTSGDSGNRLLTNTDGAIINFSGSVTSASSGYGFRNIYGTINVGGNVLNNGMVCVMNEQTGTIHVAGNVTAGTGNAIDNYSTGSIIILGQARGGTGVDVVAVRNGNPNGVVSIHEAIFETGKAVPFSGRYVTGKLTIDFFTVLGQAYRVGSGNNCIFKQGA